METKLTSPFALLRQAWALGFTRPNIVSYLILGALPQLVSFGFSAIAAYATGTTDIQTAIADLFTNTGGWRIAGIAVLGLLVLAAISFLSAWYTAFLYHVYRDTASGNLATLRGYIKPAKKVTLILLLTIITVGFRVSLGFLLFIIPGILLSVRYLFAPIIAAVEDRTVFPIRESTRLIKGRFWKLVGRGILLVACYNIPLSVLQSIHPILGSVWAVTSPVFGLYFFLVYTDFKKTAAVAS